VRAASIHLTLKFLGSIPAEQIPAVAGSMRATAVRNLPLHLRAAGIGVFPGPRRPRVLWVGLSGEMARLQDLQHDLDDGLAALGFDREERAFRGHLTLGRFSKGGSGPIAEILAAYADHTFGEFLVEELVLFKSDLKPGGAVHTALERARLGNLP
jgi:2'-5' RNA ligase